MSCEIRRGNYYSPNGQKSQLYEDLKIRVGEAQAKDLFVLAYTPNFIRDVQQELIYNYKNKFPETPSTIGFKQNGNTIQAQEQGINKGKIVLIPVEGGYSIKSISVTKDNKDKGYEKALSTFVVRKMISEGLNTYNVNPEYFTEVGTTIYAKPLNAFNINGEINAESVLEYATQLNENTEPLSPVEQQEVRMLMTEFPEIEDSDELSDQLTKAFYKNGLFAPTRNSLKSLYSKYESDLILSDVNLLGQVKESIEKLKRTPKIYNTTVLPSTYKTNDLNAFGKLKVENPYIIDQDIVEQYGGIENADLSEIKNRDITQEYLDQFKRVPALYEDGSPIIEEVIYTDAIKTVDNPKIFEAVDAILNAPDIVDTTKIEQKLSNWLLNYGINIEGFTKELLPSLKLFIENPSIENTQLFSDVYREVFNIPIKQREYVTKLDNKDRDLVYMQTNQSEQVLFDTQNLLQTPTQNVYHRIERVDFEQMKEAFNLTDDITELQAYKNYFNYTENPVLDPQEFYPIEINNSADYLTNEFIADFNVEKLKNPQSELYNKFKITEKGIEQIYKDPISMAQIMAELADESKMSVALQEYSIMSKQMENLIDDNIIPLNNKYNNRLFAINNFSKIKVANGDITLLNSNTAVVKNGTEEFLNIENELFELVDKEGNENIYIRIDKNSNLDYNEMNPQITPEQVVISNKTIAPKTEYTKIKRIQKTNLFDC